ncbi:poly-gamma-glutamate biosynthesis protein PgsC [bacterium]|nr:poly-gamma-glutamate biosynthesis protein PgsC [bacterium]
MTVELTFIGLLITLAFIGITGLYPGGIIVPAYLVLYVDQPARLGATLLIALVTAGLYRIAGNWLILFGRRRLVFMLMTGGVLVFLFRRIMPGFSVGGLEFQVIGWIIPGLIANHLERQGVWRTIASLIIVTVAIYGAGLALQLLR